MKVFRNRFVAILLCLILVAGATLVNTHWKFGGLCRELANVFYADEEIGKHLEVLQAESAVLATVAQANGIDASALTGAADELGSCLRDQNAGVSRIYAAYAKLTSAMNATEQKLLSVALSESDAETVRLSLARIHTAQVKISSSNYNAQVQEFLRRYDRFPTNLLAKLAGVEMPEVFA